MNGLGEVELRVLEKIRPRREEYVYVEERYRRIRRVIEEVLREKGVEGEVSLEGSFAKDTWLSGEYDLDIFLLLPPSYTKQDIREKILPILIEVGRRIGYYETRYAEHPYVRVRLDSVEADIVPAIKVPSPSEIKTAVDRTPFHTRYVMERLEPWQRDHVRLLKKFMKGIRVYGAEVRVKGFSGYMAELLIIKYGGFRETLKAASEWKPPVYIEIDGLRPHVLRRRYRDSVMFLPDPVDPLRNVAAAVSPRALATFILASSCYLAKPSMEYFFPPPPMPLSPETLRDRCVVAVVFTLGEKLPPDTLWGELHRVRDRAVKILANYGFTPIYADAWSDEERHAAIVVELEQCVLPPYKQYSGPPAWVAGRARSFLAKHLGRSVAGPWIDYEGRLSSLDPRRIREAAALLREMWSQYITAPHLRRSEWVVVAAGEAVEMLGEGYAAWLSQFLERRPAWMRSCID